jgi:hypothetical protein
MRTPSPVSITSISMFRARSIAKTRDVVAATGMTRTPVARWNGS